jgi:hypothetical protein
VRDRALLAIVALALVLNLVGLDWGLPWNLSASIDDISPWKPLGLPFTWAQGFHKYPYLHWMISLALYLPYLAWLAATGGLDLTCLPTILPNEQCFADYPGTPTVLMLISRVLSVAMGAGIVVLVHRIALLLHGDRVAALAAAAIAAVCHGLVVYSHLGNLDVPVTFWFLVSLVFAVRLVDGGGRRDAVLFAVTAAFALATKDGIIGGYVLVGPLLWIAMARSRGRFFHTDGFLLVAVLLAIYGAIQNAVFNWAGFVEHWSFWLSDSAFVAGQRAESPGLLHVVGRIWQDLGGAMGRPLVLVTLAGLVWGCVGFRHRVRLRWLLVPTVSYFALSVVYPAFVSVRILVPLIALLAVFGGTLVADAVRHPRARWLAVPVFALAWGWGFLFALQGDLLMHRDGRQVAEEWLQANVPTTASIASCSVAVDLPRLDILGYEPIWVPGDENCLKALATLQPDYVVVSSASARRMLAPNLPGWRTVWQGTGTTALSPTFDSPLEWLNPTVRILEAAVLENGA